MFLLIIALCLSCRAAVVGNAQIYEPAKPLDESINSTLVLYFGSGFSPADIKNLIKQNVQWAAYGTAGVLFLIGVSTCIMATDGCVKRRLNRNRYVRVSVDPHPHKD